MSSNQLTQKPKPLQLLNFTLELLVAIALTAISISQALVHVGKQLKCNPTQDLLPIKLPLKDVPTA